MLALATVLRFHSPAFEASLADSCSPGLVPTHGLRWATLYHSDHSTPWHMEERHPAAAPAAPDSFVTHEPWEAEPRFYVTTTDSVGRESCPSDTVQLRAPLAVRELDAGVWLAPPSPQPAHRVVALSFHLPTTANVTLRVYDVQGRAVATLVHGPTSPGVHVVMWVTTAPGHYIARLAVGKTALVRHIMVVR